MKRIAAIDPGSKGCLAVINDKLEVLLIKDLPTTLNGYLDAILNNEIHCPVFIEDVHALPGQSTTAGFSFGKNVALAELLATSIGEVHKVTPSVWKKAVGLKRIEGETKTEYKHRSIALAKELFPECAKMLTASKDGRAEALLIAYYGLLK